MINSAQELIDLKKEKEFLVCIDSDGCAFDAMEIKHKECFTPSTIKIWGLQAISKYVREASEFVNLYSKWRGTNRFPALVKVFELLAERDEVIKRGFKIPDLTSLTKWIESESNLNNHTLEKAAKETNDPILLKTLEWSNAVNLAITDMVHGVPPFPYVKESLEKVMKSADAIVVSATPIEALKREWSEHGIDKFVKVIAGQEMGTKKDHIRIAKNGRYIESHVLKVGDAIGDYDAAKANNVLFYPINPNDEDASWKKFYDEAFDKFIEGTYEGDYQNALIDEFMNLLPTTPPWKKI